jgi:hypothetical protein
MSWLGGLDDELRAVGLGARQREAIVLELEDHLACEPGCEARLGDPRALARQFADEHAARAARGSARELFGALALAATALALSQLSTGAAGSYPGLENGHAFVLELAALIGMVFGPQVALVAGSLALWRALRQRHEPVLAQAAVALLRRRAWVGLGGGLATTLSLELYVADFTGILPGWWLALVGASAAIATMALLVVGARMRCAGALVVTTAGPAGDIFDDLRPLRALRAHPWRFGAMLAGGVGIAMTLVTWHAEQSLAEGLQRGIVECVAATAGFAMLGRAIGARS